MRANFSKPRVLACLITLAALASGAQPCFSSTLYGGVNHSDFLAPADQHYPPIPPHPNLVPQQAVPQTVPTTPVAPATQGTLQRPVVEWFPIPKWMAGKWTKRGDITQSVTDLRTGITTPMNEFIEDNMTVTWGHQTDNQGNFWHANLIPNERDGSSQGKAVSFIIISSKVLEATPEKLATRTHYIVRESMGGQVTDIFQQESLTHYVLVAANNMDATSSNRVFTYQGRPTRDGKLLSQYVKSGGFVPLSTQGGIDMAASLTDYLNTHNMAGLVKTAP